MPSERISFGGVWSRRARAWAIRLDTAAGSARRSVCSRRRASRSAASRARRAWRSSCLRFASRARLSSSARAPSSPLPKRNQSASGMWLGQTRSQQPHSIQAESPADSASGHCRARTRRSSSWGRRRAGQTSAQAMQRIQGSSGSGRGSSEAASTKMQLVAFVTGKPSCGSARPITGPPTIRRAASSR